ncbi:hypothetical protein B0T22DRAFT_12045 [Podospora appendiculata]|uniref:Uncharacterized protein n=1 Tax=Podospora appendiculata TaxID=314037 RepID=A0AAE1CFE4_9PEZI|nr:hypothetical protein B0T22DRAFT_12045 [Podospora appendiculata]
MQASRRNGPSGLDVAFDPRIPSWSRGHRTFSAPPILSHLSIFWPITISSFGLFLDMEAEGRSARQPMRLNSRGSDSRHLCSPSTLAWAIVVSSSLEPSYRLLLVLNLHFPLHILIVRGAPHRPGQLGGISNKLSVVRSPERAPWPCILPVYPSSGKAAERKRHLRIHHSSHPLTRFSIETASLLTSYPTSLLL